METKKLNKIERLLNDCSELIAKAKEEENGNSLKYFYHSFIDLKKEVSSLKNVIFDKKVLLTELQSMVAEISGIPDADLHTRNRKRELVVPRQIVMAVYFSAFHDVTQAESGEVYDRDHATVLHALKTIADLKDTDKFFNRKYKEVWDWGKKQNHKFNLRQKNDKY